MVGQIMRGSDLGNIIYDLCAQDDIKNIVDIGTWNGMGTTKCIYDSIIENNKKDYMVISLESNPIFYEIAVGNIPKIDNFNLVLGRIVEEDELIDVEECDDSFFNNSDRDPQRGWLLDDITNYKMIENVLDIIPITIDLLILDGGEFSSLSEYNKLKDRTKYIILDDTNTIKNNKVADIIRKNNDYKIIADSNSRNGYLIAKKINN
jgi:hypothetical protein